MERTYKKPFWIILTILVFSNVYWLYHTFDVAVGHSYFKSSCDGYYKDVNEFKKIIASQKTKRDLLVFFDSNSVKYDSFQKGSDFIINLNSISIEFDKNGNQKNIELN